MAILKNIPLTLFVLIAYNLFAFGIIQLSGPELWQTTLFELQLISKVTWVVSLGDMMIIIALILLFFEIMKATRTSQKTILDHLLSTLVFILFLVEFIVLPEAGTSVFFICGFIALLDVIAGYTISIRVASRDIALGGGGL